MDNEQNKTFEVRFYLKEEFARAVREGDFSAPESVGRHRTGLTQPGCTSWDRIVGS